MQGYQRTEWKMSFKEGRKSDFYHYIDMITVGRYNFI